MARRLGDILIEERLITLAQRDEALRLQKLYGGRIGTNLVELRALDLEALARTLAVQKGVPAALQKHFDSIHGEAVALVPAQLAQKHSAIPLGFTARHPKTIAVAFLDPAKAGAIEEIQVAASSRVYPVVAPELQIYLYLEKLYGIPRQVRFLRLDLGSADAAGRWTPMSTPAAETRTDDPHAFFDMSRPDLSQPRAASAILLTEAVPPGSKAATSPRSNSAPPTAQTRPPAAGGTKASSEARSGTPAPSPKPSASKKGGEAIAKAAERAVPPVVAPAQQAGSKKTTQQSTPASPAESHSRAGSASRSGQPSSAPLTLAPSPNRAMPSQPSTTLSGKASAPSAAQASKPAQPTSPPPSASSPRPPPETVLPRAERRETNSRLPTIPELPAFAIGRDAAQAPSPRDLAKAAAIEQSSSTAPTIKDIDFSPGEATADRSPTAASATGVPPKYASPPTPPVLPASAPSTQPPASEESADNGEYPPAAPPAPPLESKPWSAAQAVDAMAVATNRDQVADAILNYLRSACGVGLVLIVQHEVAMGWKGFAPGVSSEMIDALAIPLAAPSVLQIAHKQQTIFRGAPPNEGAALDGQLWMRLRSPQPQEVIVAPILIRDRVVNLIYAHAANSEPLSDRLSVGLSTLSRAAAAAYVRLIQDTKKKGAD